MHEVVIAGYQRSPFTFAEKGALAKVHLDDMAAAVVKRLLEATGVEGGVLEDVILPRGRAGIEHRASGRISGPIARHRSGATVNRFCGSSMQAIHMAAGAIRMNAGEAFVCGGVESMTRVPMPGFNPLSDPGLYARFPQAYVGMGETAENLAPLPDRARRAGGVRAVESRQGRPRRSRADASKTRSCRSKTAAASSRPMAASPSIPVARPWPACRRRSIATARSPTLFATLNVLDGTIIGRNMQRHRH
jgi:acetyl-CoA acyltransferase